MRCVDRIYGEELCISSSNRDFMGRQGSEDGQTVRSSPAMAAAASIEGEIVDVSEVVR